MRDPQLHLFEEKQDSANVAYLVRLLKEAKGWLTAAQLAALVDGLWSDRQIRMMSEAAGAEVISGQKGYRWIGHATTEEIDRASAWFLSQGKKMIHHAIKIKRRAHQMVG